MEAENTPMESEDLMETEVRLNEQQHADQPTQKTGDKKKKKGTSSKMVTGDSSSRFLNSRNMSCRCRPSVVRETLDVVRHAVPEAVMSNLVRLNIQQFFDLPPYPQDNILTLQILQCWRHNKMLFKLGGKELRLLPDEIALLIGMPNRGPMPKWKPRPSATMNAVNIKDRILAFARGDTSIPLENLYIKYLLSNLFFPSSNFSFPSDLDAYGDNLESFSSYNWPAALCEYLIEQINAVTIKIRLNRSIGYVNGFLFLLTLWFFEHTSPVTPAAPNARPRMLRWPRALKWNASQADLFFKRLNTELVQDKFSDVTADELMLIANPDEGLPNPVQVQQTDIQSPSSPSFSMGRVTAEDSTMSSLLAILNRNTEVMNEILRGQDKLLQEYKGNFETQNVEMAAMQVQMSELNRKVDRIEQHLSIKEPILTGEFHPVASPQVPTAVDPTFEVPTAEFDSFGDTTAVPERATPEFVDHTFGDPTAEFEDPTALLEQPAEVPPNADEDIMGGHSSQSGEGEEEDTVIPEVATDIDDQAEVALSIPSLMQRVKRRRSRLKKVVSSPFTTFQFKRRKTVKDTTDPLTSRPLDQEPLESKEHLTEKERLSPGTKPLAQISALIDKIIQDADVSPTPQEDAPALDSPAAPSPLSLTTPTPQEVAPSDPGTSKSLVLYQPKVPVPAPKKQELKDLATYPGRDLIRVEKRQVIEQFLTNYKNPGDIIINQRFLLLDRGMMDDLLFNGFIGNDHVDALAAIMLQMKRMKPDRFQKYLYVSPLFWSYHKMEGDPYQFLTHITPTSVQESDFIFFPIVNDSHWVLLVCDLKKKKWRLYDSLPNDMHKDLCKRVIKLFSSLTKECFKKKKPASWDLSNVRGLPRQTNSIDCGMFVCKYMERLTRATPTDWSLERDWQAHMPRFRAQLAYDLCRWFPHVIKYNRNDSDSD